MSEKDVIRKKIQSGEITPHQVCRSALLAVGVPKMIVDSLHGREMDYWVLCAVVHQIPWQKVKEVIDSQQFPGALDS